MATALVRLARSRRVRLLLGLLAVAAAAAVWTRPSDVSHLADAAAWVSSYLDGLGDSSFALTVVAIILASMITEDLTCIMCGLLAAKGILPIHRALVGCFLGLWLGDVVLYWAGRLVGRGGRKLLSVRPVKWFINESALARGTAWLEERGAIVVFIGRFVPGSRGPTYFASGVLRANALAFTCYFALASLVWVPLLVGGTYFTGEALAERYAWFAGNAFAGLVLLGLSILLVVKIVEPLCSYRGRRMLLGFWRRKFQWEFWPGYLANLPMIIYAFWLGTGKYGSRPVFAAANPGIDKLGGFFGESKFRILQSLNLPAENRLAMVLIGPRGSPARRQARLKSFMVANNLTYPIVLKPDVGERGAGVEIVRSDERAREVLAACQEAIIAQEYARGEEFGVFYYRYPETNRGRIYSIVRKVIPDVIGDGERSMERLILDDPRAVCMAKQYLKINRDRLSYVPADGECVRIGDIGNHAQGAIFLDARDLMTDELVEAFDRIARRFEGFYFGRFDAMVPSAEHIQRGEGIKVVELNGATSGASHVYDPDVPTLEVYRTLFKQWRILYEIGDQNIQAGVEPATIREVARAVWEHCLRRPLGLVPVYDDIRRSRRERLRAAEHDEPPRLPVYVQAHETRPQVLVASLGRTDDHADETGRTRSRTVNATRPGNDLGRYY